MMDHVICFQYYLCFYPILSDQYLNCLPKTCPNFLQPTNITRKYIFVLVTINKNVRWTIMNSIKYSFTYSAFQSIVYAIFFLFFKLDWEFPTVVKFLFTCTYFSRPVMFYKHTDYVQRPYTHLKTMCLSTKSQ